MPNVKVAFYKENDGTIPALEWLRRLGPKARAKWRVRLERLALLGHELRRPEADYLREGIYELRVGLHGLNYRMLYFFHGTDVVVVSQGLIKDQLVPPEEIDRAIKRKNEFEGNPLLHTQWEWQL